MDMRLRILALAMLLPWVTGCSQIKSYFPDKEKDYRFTSEIPELVIPDDLKNSPAVTAKPVGNLVSQGAESISTPAAVTTQALKENPAIPAETLDDQKEMRAALADIPAENGKNYAAEVDQSEIPQNTEAKLIEVDGAAAHLQVNQTLQRTWRIVSKALTRKTLEVTKRNQEENYFLVQYEPEVKEMKDDSMLDSLNFIFGTENNQEKEYRIALYGALQQTDIQVLHTDKQICKNEKCAKLLALLQQAITEVTKKE